MLLTKSGNTLCPRALLRYRVSSPAEPHRNTATTSGAKVPERTNWQASWPVSLARDKGPSVAKRFSECNGTAVEECIAFRAILKWVKA